MRTRRYRNRRIGDFLKELHLVEGRNTGIPTAINAIKKNGSPLPTLLTDEDRSFFSVIIPIHDVFAEKGIEHVKVKTKRRSKNELKELILEALDEINLLVKEARKNVKICERIQKRTEDMARRETVVSSINESEERNRLLDNIEQSFE